MRASRKPALPGRQRGWIGLVMILVALAIVGYLAKDALKQANDEVVRGKAMYARESRCWPVPAGWLPATGRRPTTSR